ncbi:hypothetical protein NQZ68_020855 [Dissostichus eleginoides]|nr:hypothetical protein NQZ68_020855 [Dissostichus eleginoides]
MWPAGRKMPSTVLCRQNIKGKLMTPYGSKPYTIVKIRGSMFLLDLTERMIWIYNFLTHQMRKLISSKTRISTLKVLFQPDIQSEQTGDHHNVSLLKYDLKKSRDCR